MQTARQAYEPNSNDPALAPYHQMPLSMALGLTAHDAKVARKAAEASPYPYWAARYAETAAKVEAIHAEVGRRLAAANVRVAA